MLTTTNISIVSLQSLLESTICCLYFPFAPSIRPENVVLSAKLTVIVYILASNSYPASAFMKTDQISLGINHKTSKIFNTILWYVLSKL